MTSRLCRLAHQHGAAAAGPSTGLSGSVLLLPILLLLHSTLPAAAFLRPNETDCPSEALVDLSSAYDLQRQKAYSDEDVVEVDGMRFPMDTVRWIEGRPYGCACRARDCLPLCCTRGICMERIEAGTEFFPYYDPDTRLIAHGLGPEDMWQFIWDPCHGGDQYFLEPENTLILSLEDKFELLSNGSLYQPIISVMRDFSNFCVGKHNNTLRVMLCFDEETKGQPSLERINQTLPIGMIISVPFLVVTFAVYMLLPELRNLPGMTLCAYVLCLIVAYSFLGSVHIIRGDQLSDELCIILAYIVHFSFLASFFWLNVMCFDIWWTFGGFRSLHGSVRQRERKKFIMYSIYAWGCASLITLICVIMDNVPGIPIDIVRPEFGKTSCWFSADSARVIYFYGPMGATVVCNIILFIITAIKISQHKKDTARQLKGSDSRRHDDNKQWFNLYLKLFIVMGINWSMEIISWLYANSVLKYLYYVTDLTNTLQGVIIFVIFVWKDKIKRLLLRRFGCQGGNWLSRNSMTRNGGCPSSSMASRATCVTTAPLQEKPNLAPDPGSRGRANAACTDTESDCV